MSIGKIKVNTSAGGTFGYAADKEGAQIIGGNAAPWVDRDALSDEQMKEVVTNATQKFMVSISLNNRVKQSVGHISVSFPPGEELDDQNLSDYCEKYFAAMILTADRPELLKDFDEPEFRAAVEDFRDDELHKFTYSIIRHTDQPHPHAHIVYSRINLETEKAIGKEFERYRSQDILRDLERQFGLTVVPNSWEIGRRAESISQIEKGKETNIVSVQKQLQTAIEEAATDHPTMPQLIEKLQSKGIGVKIDFTRTGKQKGVSYTLDNVPIAGNKLGNRYSFPGLSKHLGVDYEAARDNERIVELCARVVVKPVPLTPAQKAAQDEYDTTAAAIRAADPQSVLTDEQIAKRMSARFHLELKPNEALSGDKALVLSRSPLVQTVMQSHGEKAAKSRWQKIIDFGFDYAKAQKQKGAGR